MTIQEQAITTTARPTTTRKAKRRRLTGRLDHKINAYRAATGIEKQRLEKQLLADCKMLAGRWINYYHQTCARSKDMEDIEAAARVGLGIGIATWDASLCPYPHVWLRTCIWAEMQREAVGAHSMRMYGGPRDSLTLKHGDEDCGDEAADVGDADADEGWDRGAEFVRLLSDEDKALLKGAKTRAELPRRRELLERLRSVIDGCATPRSNPQTQG